MATAKQKRALAKARRAWKKMSPKKRAAKMPGGKGRISKRRKYRKKR